MTQTSKSYDNLNIKKIEKSQIEITASIPPEIWEKFRTEAVKNLNNKLKLDGFRQGMIPENILIGKIGEMAVLEEMAELALPKSYVDILIDNKIDSIGKPSIHVTKLAKGNPLEFKAVTAVVPEIKLPDYKKISTEEVGKKSPDETNISDKDVDEAILKIRKSRVSHEGHDHSKLTPDEHDKLIMSNLPELNDEFIKSLGKFENVEDFKAKVKEMLVENKKDEAKDKLRIRLADAITDATSLELPDVMIESEINRMQSQFETDIERMNVKLEDYLKHSKKTLEDIRKEWRQPAEKKAKLQLILNEIAKVEKISPTKEEIENEVNHLIEHYKDADRERAAIYAETVLTNEKVFQWLEKVD